MSEKDTTPAQEPELKSDTTRCRLEECTVLEVDGDPIVLNEHTGKLVPQTIHDLNYG